MAVDLISPRDIDKARSLVQASGLRFEENFQALVGIFEGHELIAVGARDRNVLKMLTIAPSHQSGSVLGELITPLIQTGVAAGYETLFVFTEPRHAASFQSLNFTPLVHLPRLTLLEYGKGLQSYLEAHETLRRPGDNGAVVVNCNPFTLGHRFLIEEAAEQVDTLYVFVVREDRSVFPFDVRLRLVREGTGDLENVRVLDTSHYAVSAITFPAYFLKEDEEAATLQMEVDLELFGRRIAPFFQVKKRFVGTEPYCRTTRDYSQTMKRILPPLGVEAIELRRREVQGEAVSAFRVRQAIRREAFETVRRLVPPTTLHFLHSHEGRRLCEKLRAYDRRH